MSGHIWPRRSSLFGAFVAALLVGTGLFTGVAVASCGCKSNPRLRGAETMVREGTLIGLSRQEVVAKYGEPLRIRFYDDWDVNYWIRQQPGFCIDDYWLLLEFEEDRVVEAKIMGD